MRGIGGGRIADPIAGKAFMIVVGAALVAIGISMWRERQALEERPPDREVRRLTLSPAFVIGAGVVVMLAMAAGLVADAS